MLLTWVDSTYLVQGRDHHGRDRMVVGFTTTYVISANHHWSCEFESSSGEVYLLCGKVCQWLVTGRWVSPDTNKTDRHDITAILLNVVLNTITLNLTPWFKGGKFVLTIGTINRGWRLGNCFPFIFRDVIFYFTWYHNTEVHNFVTSAVRILVAINISVVVSSI